MNTSPIDLGDEADLEKHIAAAVALLRSQSTSKIKSQACHPTVDQLASLFADAARYRAKPEALLERLGAASSDAQSAICAAYAAAVDDITAVLDGWGTREAQLLGAAWEVGHSLGDRVSVPEAPTRSLPVVTLSLGTTWGDVVMRCTAEQLSDLLAELDAAVASTGRIAKQF